ncbi:ProQ/FINO family protein [Ensifer sp. LCM 4579]|uniref:ProQ/FINO family protein n=1 Tax=Ensifer sp. LCM 4579 TaxID=1848292 RepID=UPI0008DAA9A0|nr:ProQ/FinO family protein [Ensifer sp. LCM 4579]OHV72650.1 hypothetical protein LCM4579_11120 [Ensifer sp. LCM 4579]
MSTSQRKSVSALFRHLAANWPAAFNPDTPKPLKVGIDREIRACDHGLSEAELKRALRAYTKMDKYLASMRPGAIRVDLDGNPSGEVSEADAAGAQGILRRRKTRTEVRQAPDVDNEHARAAGRKPERKLTTSAGNPQVVVEIKRRRLLRKQGP